MKKFSAILLLLAALSFTAGCSSSDNRITTGAWDTVEVAYPLKQIHMFDSQKGWALTTENELLFTDKGTENFSIIKKIEGINAQTDNFVNASFVNDRTIYLIYFSQDNENLILEYTHDGGTSWQQTLLQYSEYGEVCDAGSAYICFPDETKGYLLYCSTPAAGIMTKILLCTTDGGRSFSLVKDLTQEIAGYPQGITFCDNSGYIAVSYHGNEDYLYTTSDDGVTWENMKILTQNDNDTYVDGYPPLFSGTDHSKGIMVLKLVNEEVTYQLYTTDDNGLSWVESEKIPCESLASYSYIDKNHFLFLDGEGNVYALSK